MLSLNYSKWRCGGPIGGGCLCGLCKSTFFLIWVVCGEVSRGQTRRSEEAQLSPRCSFCWWWSLGDTTGYKQLFSHIPMLAGFHVPWFYHLALDHWCRFCGWQGLERFLLLLILSEADKYYFSLGGGDIPQREESGTFSGWVSRVAVLGRNHLYYLGSVPWVSVKKHYSVNNAMRFRRISLISEETCTLQKWCFPDLECTGLKMFAIHSLI